MSPALPRIAYRSCSAVSLVTFSILDRVPLQTTTLAKLRLFSTQSSRGKVQDLEAILKKMPPKPEPPSNEDCCMSGCEFCVWDLYDEDMREYQKHATKAREAFEAQGKVVPEQLRPENLRDSMDPSMRAFLDMEREMAMKIQQEEENNDNGD